MVLYMSGFQTRYRNVNKSRTYTVASACSGDRLGFHAEIQIIFGTVWAGLAVSYNFHHQPHLTRTQLTGVEGKLYGLSFTIKPERLQLCLFRASQENVTFTFTSLQLVHRFVLRITMDTIQIVLINLTKEKISNDFLTNYCYISFFALVSHCTVPASLAQVLGWSDF